jgi:hypothetical protein
MTGKVKGFVGRFKTHSFYKLLQYSLRCFLCQGYELLLCSQSCDPTYQQHTQSRAFQRRNSANFLTNSNKEEQRELLIHCTVRWLPRDQASERFWGLRILEYLGE